MRTTLRSARVGSDEQANSDRYGIEPVAVAEEFDKTHPYGRAMPRMASVSSYPSLGGWQLAGFTSSNKNDRTNRRNAGSLTA